MIEEKIPYIDNSVLSEMRLPKGKELADKSKVYLLNTRNIKLIFKILSDNQLLPKNILITEKLFLEIIGQGKVRKDMINSCSDCLKALRKDILLQENANKEFGIACLEYLLTVKFKESLPRDQLVAITMKYLKEYPFIDLFYCFERKVIEYAWDLERSVEKYNQFISVLVADTLIRYLLLDFDKLISEEILSTVLTLLVAKNDLILHEQLLILSAGLKRQVEFKLKIKGKGMIIWPKDDFADAEPQNLVFYGKEVDGILYPITFLTFEQVTKIEERLKYYFCAGIVPIAQNSPRRNKRLYIGRSIVIESFEKLLYKEIPSERYLKLISAEHYSIGEKSNQIFKLTPNDVNTV